VPPASHRIFYGWYIVAGVFVITMTTAGLAFYNLSILLAAFVAERGFPVGLASSATSAVPSQGGWSSAWTRASSSLSPSAWVHSL
jgi:hypothetical protein